jgi:hypothetical protein
MLKRQSSGPSQALVEPELGLAWTGSIVKNSALGVIQAPPRSNGFWGSPVPSIGVARQPFFGLVPRAWICL